MKRFGKKHQKRVAKLVAAALMCAGGGLCSLPSAASAEITTTGTAPNDLATQTTSNILDNSGRAFWSCSAYPECNGTRSFDSRYNELCDNVIP